MKAKNEGTERQQQQPTRPQTLPDTGLMAVQEKLGLFKPPQPQQAAGEHKFLEDKPLGFI